MPEIQTIRLSCNGCGASLEISPSMTHFACGYCGSNQIVERKGGTVSLKSVTDAIGKVQVGTDKTAAELALKRLTEELNSLVVQRAQLRESLNEAVRKNEWKRINPGIGCVGMTLFVGFVASIAFIFSMVIRNLIATLLPEVMTVLIGLLGLSLSILAAILYIRAKDRRLREQAVIVLDAELRDIKLDLGAKISGVNSRIAQVNDKIEKSRAIADS